jgi:flagellar hook-length control protein FliK
MSPQVQNLYTEVQKLPEVGKWLPLLQQALDETAHAGGDPRQLLQQIVADVRELQSQQSLSLQASLHAVLATYPTNAPVLPQTAMAPDHSLRSLVPGPGIPPAVQTAPVRDQNPTTGVPVSKLSPESVLPIADRTAGLIPQVATDRLQPEQTALATALRQFTRTQPVSATDMTARLESLSNVLTSQPVTAPTTQVAASVPSVNVNHPLNQPGWDQAFGEKIQWLVGQRIQGAQIRLNPAQLGPMEVNIQVRNEQASIQFNSAHLPVREALEAAIPRLRDMMESSGVELVDVDISGGAFAERQAGKGRETVADSAFDNDEPIEAERSVETPVAATVAAGRLDLFA